jgi:hypothetical protein
MSIICGSGFSRTAVPRSSGFGAQGSGFEVRLNRWIIISGLPGSGKTTIARALGPLLRLPVIDKDDILEELFESRGIGDARWRRQLSRESDTILQSRVSSSAGAVVSSFWHCPGMPADSGTPTGWLEALGSTTVNVYCHCPPELAADRFLNRARHPGHLDRAKTPAQVLESIRALARYEPLGLGRLIMLDTTLPLEAAALAMEIESTTMNRGNA